MAENTGCSQAIGLCTKKQLLIICDWLWENPPVMHKDNYLEKRN